eukprot:15457973-Alexandrium_andersonii.AAC.1
MSQKHVVRRPLSHAPGQGYRRSQTASLGLEHQLLARQWHLALIEARRYLLQLAHERPERLADLVAQVGQQTLEAHPRLRCAT